MQAYQQELRKNKFTVYLASNSVIQLHGHDYLEFAYVLSGTMEHRIGEETYILYPGDYFIVDHGTKHQYRRLSQEPLRVMNLLFYPEFLERCLADCRSFRDVMNSYLVRFCYETLKVSPTEITFHDDTGRIRQIIKRIRSEYSGKDYGYLEYIRCLFVEALVLTLRKIENRDAPSQKSPVINEIMEHMQQHYAEKLQLADYAKQYHYSAAHLSRKFAQETGMSFLEQLQKLRIAQSCHLLTTTDQKVSQIAANVGYEDIKFFNLLFKQKLGMTPREFRSLQRQYS